MNKLKIVLASLVYIIFASPLANAAAVTGVHTISQLVVDATAFGGCMLKVSPGPENFFAGCKPAFVSLGCDGTLGVSKASGNQLFSAAQLAFVMGKTVVLTINDENSPTTSYGYCLADRVDVVK